MASRTRDNRTIMQVLDDLTELWERKIRDAFLVAVSDVTDNVVLNRVVEAVEQGDVERVFRMLGFNERALAPLLQAIEGAYSSSQMGVFATFPVRVQNEIVRGVFRSDDIDIGAANWLRNHSSKLVKDLTNEARLTTQQTLADGMLRGDNPRKVALDLVGRKRSGSERREGGFINLASNQQQWVSSAQRQLENLDARYFNKSIRDKRFDSTVRKAIESGKPLTADQITKIVGAYSDRVLKYRGDMIGRTEAMTALNTGAFASINEAIDAGQLKKEAVIREWDATMDRRTRRSHYRMNGQKRTIDEPFETPPDMLGRSYQLMYPLDSSLGAPAKETVACRCRQKIIIDWLMDVD